MPRMKSLNHVGVAVRDIDAAIELYRTKLGLELESIDLASEGTVRIAFIPIGDTLIELVSPAVPGTKLDNYIKEHGERIHHMAFDVDDINGEIALLKGMGVAFDEPCPRRGAHGTSIAFLEPAEMAGALVELVEATPESIALREAVRAGKH